MKKRFSIAVLLTIILGLLPSTMAYSQTYSISPSGYTEKPTYQSLSNSWIGYTTGSNSIWIETKAEKSGSSVVFYVRKSSGTFQNSVSYKIRRDVEVSGSKVTSEGTQVGSGSISAGKSSGSCTITPTSGSHEYRVILTSGSMTFYSRIVKITVEAASPTKPSSPTPSNGATNVATSGTFSWSTSPNDGGSSISYDLYLDTKSDFSSSGRLYNSGQGKSCSYSNLKPGTKYYWKVIVYNSSGKSIWSDAWSFTTKDAASPTKPSSPTPSNGATNVATSGTFSWSTSPNDGGSSISYDLYLDTKSDFSSSGRLYNSGQGKSCSYSNLKPGTKYYWKVIVYNSSGKSIWSDAWSFTTKDAASPTKPSSPTPSNGATNVATSGTFSWSTSPNDGGSSISYDLYLDTKSDFSSSGRLYNSGQGKSCSYSGLKANTKYYWKVIVYNSSGKSIWSDAWSFTTKSDEVATPTKPSSPSPSNGGTNVSTSGTFSWSTSPNDGGSSISYDLYLDTKSDFSSSGRLYNSGQGKSCSYSGLKANTKYYWKVIVYNGSGGHIWSDAWSFTTKSDEVSAPTKPSSPTPSNGISGVATSGTFKWGASANDGGSTLNYDLYIDTSSSFANVSKPYKSGKGTSCTYAGLKAGTKHYWKVIVYNGSGKSTWSDVWSFTTAAATTSFGAPAFNTISAYGITSSGATVSWGDVVNATSYDVQISNTSNFGKIIDTGYGKPGRTYYSSTNLQASTTYYVRIRAKNSSQTSSWTNTYTFKTTAAKTNEELTELANLTIYGVNGFGGAAKLPLGSSYQYKVGIDNAEESWWNGNIYLNDGTRNVKVWENVVLPKGVSYLKFDYTPQALGTKDLTLSYQTNGSGKERKVNEGIYSNPIRIQIVNSTETIGMKLNSSLSCTPSKLQIGEQTILKISILNDGVDDWTGVLAFTDNGKVLVSKKYTFQSGATKSIQFTWTPNVVGKHQVALNYEGSDGTFKDLPSNGFSSSGIVEVAQNQANIQVSKVRMQLITKGLAPENVTPGTEVYYHFLVTDENKKPIKGLKAIFNVSGTGVSKSLESTETDDFGIMTLTLKTDGDDKIAERGQTATLICNNFKSKETSNIPIDKSNSDYQVSLRVISKSEGGLFENVEKVKVEFDKGVSGKVGKKNVAEASLSYANPIALGFNWNRAGDLESFTVDTEHAIEGNANVGLWNFVKAETGGEVGEKMSATFTTSSKKAVIYGILSLCEALYMGTSRTTLFGAYVIEKWFNKNKDRFKDLPIPKQSFYAGFSLEGSVKSEDLFSKFPGVGEFVSSLKTPASWDLPSKLNASGKIAVKFEPWKTKDGLVGEGRSLKIKTGGIGSSLIGSLFFLTDKTDKRHWQASNIDRYFGDMLVWNAFTFGDINGIFSAKEEEYYYNLNGKNLLREISNTVELTSSKEAKFEDLAIGEVVEEGSGGSAKTSLSTSFSSKFTSKGNWATFLQNEINNSPAIGRMFPAMSGQSVIGAPMAHYNVLNEDFTSILSNLKVDDPTKYNIKDAMKVEQLVKSELNASVKIPIKPGFKFKFTLDLGLSMEVENHPSTSYYSVAHKRFFPVALQPLTTIQSISKTIVERIKKKIDSAFNGDEEELDETAIEVGSAFETDENGYLKFEVGGGHGAGYGGSWTRTRHPALAETDQKEICNLSFTLNDGTSNFNNGTKVGFSHFYPAGDLLAVTEEGDTMFVVSEVAELSAKYGENQLTKTHNGQFKLETSVGVDDLTPFGLKEDTPLGIYHANDGSDIWHYVGPVGTPVMVESLGAYIIATSIQNDVICPEIIGDIDSDTGVLHFKVSDNIGIVTKSIQILVNGEIRQAVCINESNYEVQLSPEDMTYRLNVYASINDIAGNKGEIFQIFQTEKPEKIRIEDLPDTDVSLLENTIYVDPVTAKTGGEVTLSVKMKNSVQAEGFQFDLELPEGVTVAKDADGFPEAYLSTARTTSRKTNYFDSSFLENGALRVVAGSTNGSAIDGNDGEVVTIKLNVAKNVPAGSYPILIRNIAISDTNSDSHNVAYVKSTMTVSSGVLGDASGNGTVGPEDITAVVRYIMEGYYDGFNFNNADLNGDDNVDAADLVRLIKMVNP